jgi:hypothetical protein
LLVVPAAVVVSAHGWNARPSGPTSPWRAPLARTGRTGQS